VITLARSGSTLLRYLLDGHPEVVSPPETNLSALLQHLVDIWRQTEIALGKAQPTASGAPPPPSDEVCRRARKAVDEIMVSFADAAGASLYCDKSLTTVDHLETVSLCYPGAPLIFLYRYPLDMIASGMEASRWGFNAFGFQPYVTAMPGNFIAGLANYWIDKTSRMLQFERTYEGANARIYYELLCDDPAATMSGLFELLGVASDESVIERAFANDHGRGPGDYKIDYTGAISMDSIGRGAALPEHLAPQQVERINELLAELDYPELAAAWRGELASLLGLKHARKPAADGRQIAESIVDLFSTPSDDDFVQAHRHALPFEIVITRAGQGAPGRVLINPDASAAVLNGAGRADSEHPRVRCAGDVLLRIAAGEVKFGNAIRDGEVRVERDSVEEPDEAERRPQEVLATLAALIRAQA
jgi:Sulfotransferase family